MSFEKTVNAPLETEQLKKDSNQALKTRLRKRIRRLRKALDERAGIESYSADGASA